MSTAESEYAHSLHERTLLAIENARVGIWDWNIRDDLLVWDMQMYRLYGHDRKPDISGVSLWENSIHPDDKENTIKCIQGAINGENDYDIAFRITWPDGSIKSIKADGVVIRDRHGNAIRMVGTNTDITNLTTAESSVKTLEKRNEALLDYSPVCHKIVDLNFNLKYMNASGCRMLSLTDAESHYGEPYPFYFFPQKAKDEMLEALAKVKATNKKYTLESLATDANGTEVWLFHTLVPVPDENGELDYISVVTADVTQRKEIEENLRHREKMDAVGQLAGGVAHDFNNQLASIMGYAQMLQEKIDDPTMNKYVSRILKAAERSSDLTNQLLNFSRKQQLEKSAVNVQEELEQTVGLLEHTIDKRITIDTQFEAPSHLVVGDKSQLQNALLNLAINARDAMPEGGNLTLSTKVLTKDNLPKSFELKNDAANSYLVIAMEDTGSGISPENLPRLFEPFFTTKAPGEGTGMGLASVYGTIKQHNGMIDVKSKLGKGSTFLIYLPLAENDKHLLRISTDEVNEPVTESSKTILVVDDETMLRELCSEILESQGHKVLEAKNGHEALDVFEANKHNIDLTVLDLMMPDLNGKQVLEKIRVIDPNAVVIISSGFNNELKEKDLIDTGAKSFVKKPFELRSFLKEVNGCLEDTQ